MSEQEKLDAIAKVHEASARLLVTHAADGGKASVYEEADGLDTICEIPGYYPAVNQNVLADGIAEMWEHRDFLLELVREQAAKLARVEEIAAGMDRIADFNAEVLGADTSMAISLHAHAEAILAAMGDKV